MNWITDLLKEYPALSVARERLEFAQDRISWLETENQTLREQNAALEVDLKKLNAQLTSLDVSAQYVEYEGVLWKRKGDEGFEKFAYCPTCRLPMSDFAGLLVCKKCNWEAPFDPVAVQTIHSQLSGSNDAAPTQASQRDETEVAILQLLCQADKRFTAEQTAQHVNVPQQRLEYHLQEMCEKAWIHDALARGREGKGRP